MLNIFVDNGYLSAIVNWSKSRLYKIFTAALASFKSFFLARWTLVAESTWSLYLVAYYRVLRKDRPIRAKYQFYLAFYFLTLVFGSVFLAVALLVRLAWQVIRLYWQLGELVYRLIEQLVCVQFMTRHSVANNGQTSAVIPNVIKDIFRLEDPWFPWYQEAWLPKLMVLTILELPLIPAIFFVAPS